MRRGKEQREDGRPVSEDLSETEKFNCLVHTVQSTSVGRIHIKWKTVLLSLILVLILAIITYKFLNSGPTRSCVEDEDAFESTEVRALNHYCNDYKIPVTGDEDFTLKSVHIVIRHGDRSPLHTVPGIANQHFACRFSGSFHNSVPNAVDYLRVMKARGVRKGDASYAGVAMYPSSETCDIGGLTPNGALQHLQLGSFLRQRYINIHHLFDGILENFTGKVLVRGTNLTRTLQSAVALMYGFEPRLDLSQFGDVESSVNNTMCTSKTGHQCQCDAVARYLDAFAPTHGQTSLSVRGHPGALRVAEHLRTSARYLPRLSHVFDVAMTHFCHHKTPECMGTALARDVFSVLGESGRRSVSDSRYLHLSRLKMQPLLYEIAHRMSKNSSKSFVLYSAHDSTVEPLASALGVSDGTWPRYASRIVFELFERRSVTTSWIGSRYVRILYNGKDMTHSVIFCQGEVGTETPGLCPLSRFLEFVTDVKFDGSSGKAGYEQQCKKTLEFS